MPPLEKIIVLLGPPAVGKGVTSDYLQQQGYAIVSPGTKIREEIAAKTEFGRAVQEIVESGGVPDDDFAVPFLQKCVEDAAMSRIVIDGLRSLGQARWLDRLTQQHGLSEQDVVIIELHAPKEVLLERRAKRQAQSVQRADDTPERFLVRLDLYENYTRPIREHFGHRVWNIDAACAADDMINRIANVLAKSAGRHAIKPPNPALPQTTRA